MLCISKLHGCWEGAVTLPFFVLKKKNSSTLWFELLKKSDNYSLNNFRKYLLCTGHCCKDTTVLKSHFPHAYILLAYNRSNNNEKIKCHEEKQGRTGATKNRRAIQTSIQYKHFKGILIILGKIEAPSVKGLSRNLCSNLLRPKYSKQLLKPA